MKTFKLFPLVCVLCGILFYSCAKEKSNSSSKSIKEEKIVITDQQDKMLASIVTLESAIEKALDFSEVKLEIVSGRQMSDINDNKRFLNISFALNKGVSIELIQEGDQYILSQNSAACTHSCIGDPSGNCRLTFYGCQGYCTSTGQVKEEDVCNHSVSGGGSGVIIIDDERFNINDIVKTYNDLRANES